MISKLRALLGDPSDGHMAVVAAFVAVPAGVVLGLLAVLFT